MQKNRIAKAPKPQEAQAMKAARHEMHKSTLGLKQLKEVRDEEHNSTQNSRH